MNLSKTKIIVLLCTRQCARYNILSHLIISEAAAFFFFFFNFHTTLSQPEHLSIKLNTGKLFSLLILNYCKCTSSASSSTLKQIKSSLTHGRSHIINIPKTISAIY